MAEFTLELSGRGKVGGDDNGVSVDKLQVYCDEFFSRYCRPTRGVLADLLSEYLR